MKYYLTTLLVLTLFNLSLGINTHESRPEINKKTTNDSIVILCDTLLIYEEDPETGELNLNLDIYCDTIVVDW